MSLKFCYQNEIHRVVKIPQDFNALLKALQEIFASNLPNKFTVEYQDSEGDKIIIHNDEDYALALETELVDNKKSLKIFVKDVADLDNVSFVTKESICITQEQETQATQASSKSFEILPEVQEILPEIKEVPAPLCSRKKSLSIIIPTAEPKAVQAPVLEVQNVEQTLELGSGVAVLAVQKACVEIKEEQYPAELGSGVQVLGVQKACLEIKEEQQNPLELNSGVKVLSVNRSSYIEEFPVEINSGVKVLDVQKALITEESPAEIASGIKVLGVKKVLSEEKCPSEINSGIQVVGVRKAVVNDECPTEIDSGVKVLSVQRTLCEEDYPVELDSGVKVLSVHKASLIEEEVLAEPDSGVEVLCVQKALATETSLFEPNSGIKVLSVRKVSPSCCNSSQESPVELGSGVTVLSIQKGKKAKKVQKIARETLYEEISDITSMIKELLEAPETKKSKGRKNQNKYAVHSRVICDMCQAFPIVGDRYKCLVLKDYDLCRDCEKVANHPYPLIKIRDESQYSFVDAFFQEQPKKKQHNKKTKKGQNEMWSFVDGLISGDDKLLANLTTELIPNFAQSKCGKNIEEIIQASIEELQPLLKNEIQAFDPVNELNNLVCGFVNQLDAKAAVNKNQEVTLPCEKKVNEKKLPAGMTQKVESFLEIFPQIEVGDVHQLFVENPNKSVEDLVLDIIAAC